MNINKDYIKECLSEYERAYEKKSNNKAAYLELALFVEETFSMELSDDEITLKNFDTIKNAEAFLINKMGL